MPQLCKFCGYYQPTGRRGGMCSVFNTPVCGRRTACCLALPAFKTAVLPLSGMLEGDELASLLVTDDLATPLLDPETEDELFRL